MSIFQKCRVNVAKGLFEKHVVSIMLRIVIFHSNHWLHTFLSVLWSKGFRVNICCLYIATNGNRKNEKNENV